MWLIFIMPRGLREEKEGRGVIIDIIMAAKKKCAKSPSSQQNYGCLLFERRRRK